MSTKPAPTVVNKFDVDRPTGYPTGRMYAVLDTPDALQSALAWLAADPVSQYARAFCSQAGRTRIDATGAHASLLCRLVYVPTLGAEGTHAQRYEDELAQGRYVIEIKTQNEADRKEAAVILRARGAHSINFYGRFAVEQLAP